MTQETLEKANDLNHDIKILDEIKDHQTKQHWVGFRVPYGSSEEKLDDFYSEEINNAFKEFVSTQLERAEKLLYEL